MPLNIKDPAAEKFVRELAAAAGESVTTAVRRAAEERLQRVRRQRGGCSLAAEILEIRRRCAVAGNDELIEVSRPFVVISLARSLAFGQGETPISSLDDLVGTGEDHPVGSSIRGPSRRSD